MSFAKKSYTDDRYFNLLRLRHPLHVETLALSHPNLISASRHEETSEDTLAAEMVADEDKKKEEKFQYKKSLFGQLSRHQVENLYQNYKVDFEMFGYDLEEFLGYLD